MTTSVSQIQTANNYLWDKESGTFSTDMLKLVAMITMLIDHVGAGILEYLVRSSALSLDVRSTLLDIDQVLRLIGRIAFPIFCYLLVQGFLHTRSRLKYAGNLLIFALLSEFPFDFMLSSELDLNSLNVLFTLLIGLFTLWGIEKAKSNIFLIMLVTAAGMTIAAVLSTDYSWTGILLIVSLYLFRENSLLQCSISLVLFFAAGVVRNIGLYESIGQAVIGQFSSKYTLLFSFWMIYRCNGKRYIKKGKYFFYLFYPIHLLLLGVFLRLILLYIK